MKERSEEKLVSNYKILFNSVNGKLILHDLSLRFGMLKTSYVQGDSYGTAFNEGQRSVLLFINDIINKDMGKYLENIKEQQEHYNDEFGV